MLCSQNFCLFHGCVCTFVCVAAKLRYEKELGEAKDADQKVVDAQTKKEKLGQTARDKADTERKARQAADNQAKLAKELREAANKARY